jgi:hypothetical protein
MTIFHCIICVRFTFWHKAAHRVWEMVKYLRTHANASTRLPCMHVHLWPCMYTCIDNHIQLHACKHALVHACTHALTKHTHTKANGRIAKINMFLAYHSPLCLHRINVYVCTPLGSLASLAPCVSIPLFLNPSVSHCHTYVLACFQDGMDSLCQVLATQLPAKRVGPAATSKPAGL